MNRVHELAERVLFGRTLADKLAPWPEDLDYTPGAARDQATPGRPPELALPTDHRRLPSALKADLHAPGERARVLHELANHELQATELLAMALLRWPDAPPAFRRGLVATLRDEQRHCALYLDRLDACGGRFGQVPVSRFFWDTLGDLRQVEAFVAGLSLCFEVANLDFCQYWHARFLEAGDPETAATLHTVHEDEIRHVAHGLVWHRRWADGDVLDTWRARLPSPLTPARARGPLFDDDARRRAGFSEDETLRLRLLGGSRGRPSRVLWFDAGLEDTLATGTRSALAEAVTADLATLPMFLVGAEDVVLAPPPSPALLAPLAQAGFAVPTFAAAPTRSLLGDHPVLTLEPWGPGPSAPPPTDLTVLRPQPPWQQTWAALSSKTETCRRAQVFAGHPAVVHRLGEVWSTAGDPGEGHWILKAPFSTSGTERIRGSGALTDAQRRWLDRHLLRGEVLWQPWYDRAFDFSVHVQVGERITVERVTRFTTSPSGTYTGAWLGRWDAGLAPSERRALHGDGDPARAMLPVLQEAGKRAGLWAHSLGFRGDLSLDAAAVRTRDGLRLHPWLETNARRTLGRVAMALAERLAPGSSGSWHVARRTDASLASLRAARAATPPVVVDGRLHSGVLPTTDPDRARVLLTWLAIDPPPP